MLSANKLPCGLFFLIYTPNDPVHRPNGKKFEHLIKIIFLPHSRLLFLCTSTRHVPSSSSLWTWQPEVKPLVENTAFMSEVWRSWRPLWVADITWWTRGQGLPDSVSFPDFKQSRLVSSRISHKCYKLASYLVSGLQSNLIWHATTYIQHRCQCYLPVA